MLIVLGAAEGRGVEARHQGTGGGDAVDAVLALRYVAGDAVEFDDEVECTGVQGQTIEVRRLHVDEIVGPDAILDRPHRADATLQLADDVLEDDIALQGDAGVDRHGKGGVPNGVLNGPSETYHWASCVSSVPNGGHGTSAAIREVLNDLDHPDEITREDAKAYFEIREPLF